MYHPCNFKFCGSGGPGFGGGVGWGGRSFYQAQHKNLKLKYVLSSGHFELLMPADYQAKKLPHCLGGRTAANRDTERKVCDAHRILEIPLGPPVLSLTINEEVNNYILIRA